MLKLPNVMRTKSFKAYLFLLPAMIVALLFSFLRLAGVGDEEVTLVFVGDAMQHKPQIVAATRDDGTLDYSQCFTMIEDDIAAADYAVANLEVPLGGRPYSGYPMFSAPDEFARQLGASGFDLLLTANNHCLDRGSKGLKRTVRVLEDMKMSCIGTYASREQRDSVVPFIADVKGVGVAFLNYTYGTNGIPVRDGAVVDMIDRDAMRRDIEKARSEGAKVVCVCLHWGEEYKRIPGKAQTELVDFLVDEGADVIIGSHPHVVQPFEMRYSRRHGKDVAVAYSLGNFISNQNDIDSRGGAMAVVKVRLLGGKVNGVELGYKLLFCQKPLPGKHGDNYKLVPVEFRDSVRNDQLREFDRFVGRTRLLLKESNSHEVDELAK